MGYNQLHSLFFSMSKWSQTWLEGDPLRWIPYPFYKNTLVFKFLLAVQQDKIFLIRFILPSPDTDSAILQGVHFLFNGK